MANIKLPVRFQQKLQEIQELDGIVKSTLSEFGDILKDNKLYFFEEYTDHGISHIENLLSSSDNLITDDTFNKILSSYDIAYFILTVILHDIGMHLNIEGFEALLNGDFDDIRSKELDVSTWAELWHDFLNEAKKYSGKQLKEIFGDENTIIQIPPISEKNKITSTDKKLIGEFVRKHHPRLAHEIAIKGFPGKSDSIEFAKGLDFKIRNMIGLIARSHGVDLRKCLTDVELLYGKSVRRIPNGTHAIYLMVLLRLADYIQIDKSRTSKTLIKIKTFSSPISENEHNSHLAIDDVDDKYQDDPERIFVTASPTDSKMFLKLVKLFNDIQYEFDISWAVLGELYGSIIPRPQIKYRRITSNLSEEQFKNRQNYIANSFSFKANDEIVRLLIGPLYGNEPTYGVRELLQNAIDACKERQEIEKKKSGSSYEPLVKVEVFEDSKSQSYFKISDNGVGMDPQTIKDYFLSAGASYRKNIDWQKKFIDDFGKVTVQKSGRFGIGILAAFLIGKEILVETKRPNEKNGYRFVADLFTEQINVLKVDSIADGTLIKIRIDQDVIEKLHPYKYGSSQEIRWHEWFTLKSPVITYSYLDEEVEPHDAFNPDLDDQLPNDWHSINAEGFNKVLWTYSKDYVDCNATCNGFMVPGSTYSSLRMRPILKNPQISIFDNNALTPLALNRNSFSGILPFTDELKEDVFKDYIAYLLTFDAGDSPSDTILLRNQKLNYPGLKTDYQFEVYSYQNIVYDHGSSNYRLPHLMNRIFLSKKGFIPNYNYFLRNWGKVDAILIQSERLELADKPLNLDIKDRFFYYTSSKLNSISDYKDAIGGNSSLILLDDVENEEDDALIEDEDNFDDSQYQLIDVNSRVYMKSEKYKFLFGSQKKRMPRWLNEKLKIKLDKNDWVCLHIDNPASSIISKQFLNKYSTQINFIREYEINYINNGDEILDNLLKKYIGDNVLIPYDIKKRKKKFPLAFKDLERYMNNYINK